MNNSNYWLTLYFSWIIEISLIKLPNWPNIFTIMIYSFSNGNDKNCLLHILKENVFSKNVDLRYLLLDKFFKVYFLKI